MSAEVFHSRVYTDRPAYADFAAPEKFEATTNTNAIEWNEKNILTDS